MESEEPCSIPMPFIPLPISVRFAFTARERSAAKPQQKSFNHGWTRMDTDKRPRVTDASSESVSIGVHPWQKLFDKMSDSDGTTKTRSFLCVLCVLLRPFVLVVALPRCDHSWLKSFRRFRIVRPCNRPELLCEAFQKASDWKC